MIETTSGRGQVNQGERKRQQIWRKGEETGKGGNQERKGAWVMEKKRRDVKRDRRGEMKRMHEIRNILKEV